MVEIGLRSSTTSTQFNYFFSICLVKVLHSMVFNLQARALSNLGQCWFFVERWDDKLYFLVLVFTKKTKPLFLCNAKLILENLNFKSSDPIFCFNNSKIFQGFSTFFKANFFIPIIPGVTWDWGPTQNLGPIGSAVLTFIGYTYTQPNR